MAARSAKSNSNKTDRLADRWASARAEAYRALDEFSRQLWARGINPSKIIRNDLETRTSKTFPQNTLVEMYTEWCTLRDRWFDYYKLRDEWEVASRRMENELQSLDAAEAAELRNSYGSRCDFDVSVNDSGEPRNPDDYRIGKEYFRGRTRYRRKRAKLIGRMTVPSVRVPNGWEGPRGPAYEITSLADVEAWLRRELQFAQAAKYLDPEKERLRDDLKCEGKSMACELLNTAVSNLFLFFEELRPNGQPLQPPDSSTFHEAKRTVMNLLASMVQMSATKDQGNSSEAEAVEESRQDAPEPLDHPDTCHVAQPAEKKALASFLAAEAKAGRSLTDREAFDWLTEKGVPDEIVPELIDYRLPKSFETWSRQLRGGRNAVGEQKYTSRSCRLTGPSVVREDQI